MLDYITSVSKNTPIVITIGNFDGIHLGHQQLLHQTRALAEALHCTPVLVTFSPHTLAVVRPDIQLRFLTTLQEKLALAQEYGGIAESIVITFTREVTSMDATAFMDDLRERFAIRGIVVGADFSLGHNRMGDVTFLEQYGQEHRIQVQAVALEKNDQTRISSTRIRTLLSQGQIAAANTLLGHPTLVSGTVIHGDERGRLIGFPTANMRVDAQKLLPEDGVYAVFTHVQNDQKRDPLLSSPVYKGVVNIGVRPTFNKKEHQVEVHLLDVTLDLYEKHLTIEVIAHLRGEQRFSGIEALKTQIAADVQRAREILKSRSVSN